MAVIRIQNADGTWSNIKVKNQIFEGENPELANRVSLLENKVADIPSLKTQTAKIPTIENQISDLGTIRQEVTKISTIETEVDKIVGIENSIEGLETEIVGIENKLEELEGQTSNLETEVARITNIEDSIRVISEQLEESPTTEAEQELNEYAMAVDENGICTSIEFRRLDGSLYMKSNLSNANDKGEYGTCTLQYYNEKGTAIIRTVNWQLTYNQIGTIVAKVVV